MMLQKLLRHIADIVADEDAEPFVVSLGGTDTEPYFVDVDGDSISLMLWRPIMIFLILQSMAMTFTYHQC